MAHLTTVAYRTNTVKLQSLLSFKGKCVTLDLTAELKGNVSDSFFRSHAIELERLVVLRLDRDVAVFPPEHLDRFNEARTYL